MKPRCLVNVVAIVLAGLWPGVVAPPAATAQTTVFSSDFENSIPAEFDASGAALESVQGYAGLGLVGNQFGGNFLRYASTEISDTTLTLTDLPQHDRLNLKFLLAIIDSWDGAELMEVRVDGALLFSNWFEIALGDSSSYVPPANGLLSSGTNLGFTGGFYYSRDRAYDLSIEPAFQGIVHTADTVTIVWGLGATSGTAASNWQGGGDESWAIDNVVVEVDQTGGPGPGRCSRPLTMGANPTATDCLFILKTAVALVTCDPECICAPKGILPTTAVDALICLRRATGSNVSLDCPCPTSTTTTSTTTITMQ